MDRYDIGDVLKKASLEEVVRRLGIETERRGAQTRALCPFHQDTRPSLNLFPADGTSQAHYHCFACGAHGNAIDLVKEVEGLKFPQAVQWLARQFGIQGVRKPLSQQAEREATSEAALDFALRTFDTHHDAARFKAWCDERAFDVTFLHGRGLRCVAGSVLVEGLQAKSLGERAELIDGLQALGLIKRLRSTSKADQLKLDLPDQFQDCFHDGRVLIPIHDAEVRRPEVVGFAGRSLLSVPPEGVPKYLLTSGFEKSKYLFNASAAFAELADDIRNGQPATLYIVEGFLDALRLQALGQRAVALMGISLGKGQFELLQKVVEELPPGQTSLAFSIFLDNDPAGFGGADRLTRALLGMAGVDLRWLGMPWRTQPALGKDPDTCLRGIGSTAEASTWLGRYDLPAEAVLLAAALGSQDSSELQDSRWDQLAIAARERSVFRAALAVHKLHGRRPLSNVLARLQDAPWAWANELHQVLSGRDGRTSTPGRGLYLEGHYVRASLARTLAYHGARRGELPCDEEVWLTLGANARLFDQTALDRLGAMVNGHARWRQAAPFDAVHLPRKLTAEAKVLDDPRRKVMPHPADLHLQQLLLNELLTQRHDRLSASGQTFSAGIPAVRWYASRQEIVVTGPFTALNDPDIELSEPRTLSFGYQIDMDVLEGDKSPSDQGMFRPFGQCWREFMACLAQQCHAIGPRVHVLRLDAKRYYDSIQRFVLRDALLAPLKQVIAIGGVPEGLAEVLGLTHLISSDEREAAFERLLSSMLFGYEFQDPQRESSVKRSEEAIGIPQGPVLSAYIGTIALFPVDDAARQFMRQTAHAGSDGVRRPRVGYARYVDDIVLFADSEALLKELRETLQSKAAERSIALIHKGDSVRAGSASQVMRQLNEGRGLAASVPAWEPPLVGDGEAGWGLGGDVPTVDRQCALRMLRHPALMVDPKSIETQVKAAMLAADLRPNDLGLCARWLWWQVAAECEGDQPESEGVEVWRRFWELWDSVCDGHGWAEAFKHRGYDFLYAVEGLDKLLDPNPWLENDQTLTELPKNREKRRRLAKSVCAPGFFDLVKPAENQAHIQRRTHLVARKARRLADATAAKHHIEGQLDKRLTAIEWLCLAAERIGTIAGGDDASNQVLLASLKDRRIETPTADSGDRLAVVVCQLLRDGADGQAPTEQLSDDGVALAIDFVLSSAPQGGGLHALSKFPSLLVGTDKDFRPLLIPHLPVAKQAVNSLYAIDAPTTGRYVYRYSAPPSPVTERHFAQVEVSGGAAPTFDVAELCFGPLKYPTERLAVDRSKQVVPWASLDKGGLASLEPITHRAARLFEILRAMHTGISHENNQDVFVPFKPQLFISAEGDRTTLHLLAEPVKREWLGVNAWFHDHDDRVHAVNVPQAHADLWRVGWAVADLLGVAADMAGETGHRTEQLPDEIDEPQETDREGSTSQSALLENYVLRQQLRKLQGTYVSEAQIGGGTGADTRSLPGTVRRALGRLSTFPAGEALDQQVRHLLVVEAETRAMALRLQMRSSDDLRKVLHQVFPDVLDRLPLWTLQGLPLTRPQADGALRPDLALMLTLYQTLDKAHAPPPLNAEHDPSEAPLRAALALAAVGIGLRGSVAALWGLSAQHGSRRMAERFNPPPAWSMPDMVRLDPQSDYSAIRKWLFDGDWPAMGRASPWHWMLALIGLIEANFPQAFELPALREIYSTLSTWQSWPAGPVESNQPDEPWPFDALPKFSQERCDALVLALPIAMRELDGALGLRVVTQRAQQFRRSLHSEEFTDASDASWQMAKPQFTGLGHDGVERHLIGRRWLLSWTETRRIADNELLAVHTLGFKLGQWLPSPVMANVAESRDAMPSSTLADAHAVEAIGVAQAIVEAPAGVEAQSTDADAASRGTPVAPTGTAASPAPPRTLAQIELPSWQGISLKARGSPSDGHFRVALFQWRTDDSYAHPINEAGLAKLPIEKASCEELNSLLKKGTLKDAQKAARRGAEHQWTADSDVVSWPEHRRRALLTEALKACGSLGVQLLVLPEVSVRPETVHWLKEQLKRYPELAVLAGTYREFSESDHLQEKLTLLWKPDRAFAEALDLQNDDTVLELQRGKKYRAVAANELFRPDVSPLAPLYREESVLVQLRDLRRRAGRDAFSEAQLIAALPTLLHNSPKLRYCMELICSELFLLTSPANHKPLRLEWSKLMRLFELDSNPSDDHVLQDLKALGEYLSVVQSNRERRSVLLVPACTTRSNDYWHAGQASVLASGTATVFCNAATNGSVGGSCFIGIDSVTPARDPVGVVRLLTPYHGWLKGILQPNGQGALAKDDQALVVVDLDPVHVVSGKPRPQLLPEPMSLVAYMPVVEVLNKADNAEGLTRALLPDLVEGAGERVKSLFMSEAFPAHRSHLHEGGALFDAYQTLLELKATGKLPPDGGGAAMDAFAAFFGDPEAVRQRIMAWLKDRLYQPAPRAGTLRLEPAWLDFLVADLTCNGTLPVVKVPRWLEEPSIGSGAA